MKSTKHCCDICKKSFDTSAGLYKHRRGKHPETLRVYANFTCCWDRFHCSATFRYVSEYIDHLQVKHPEANVLVEELRFDCESGHYLNGCVVANDLLITLFFTQTLYRGRSKLSERQSPFSSETEESGFLLMAKQS